MKTHMSAQRLIDAPAEVVYHLISDYAEHHTDSPKGFLPDAFYGTTVERGGVGEGTVVRFTSKLGGKPQTMTASITEPIPGRVLVETGPGVETTFTVEPEGRHQSRVRFDTVLEAAGLTGLMIRLLAPAMIRPTYAQELDRLDRYAKAHGPIAGPAASG